MNSGFARFLCLVLVGTVCFIHDLKAQTAETHVAAAKAAARLDYTGALDLCDPRTPPAAQPARPANPPAAAPAPRNPPPRSEWYAEPAKVFDNLYFVGTLPVSAWAITTSEGIILIDSLYDYSVEEEISNGLKKVGLDPAQIKYVIVTHGHDDHVGGAKFLQYRYGAKIVL